MNQEHTAMADEWFRLMNSRGWYQVSQARPESVTKSISNLQNIVSQVQGIPAQAGIQQYQQTQGIGAQLR